MPLIKGRVEHHENAFFGISLPFRIVFWGSCGSFLAQNSELRIGDGFQYVFVISGNSNFSPNMDPWTPYLLPIYFKKYQDSEFISKYIVCISQHVGDPANSKFGNYGTSFFEKYPKQLVSPNVLDKNGKMPWWNLDKSLKS